MKKIFLFSLSLCLSLGLIAQVETYKSAEELLLPEGAVPISGFEVPQNAVVAGYDNNGALQVVAGGEITGIKCDCSSGKGECKPFHGPSTIGCATTAGNPCSTCKGTLIKSVHIVGDENGDGTPDVVKMDIPLLQAGIVDFNIEPSLVPMDKIKHWENYPSAFEAMFELPQVQSKLAELSSFYYPDGIPQEVANYDGIGVAPDGFDLYPMLFFGRKMVVLLPSGLDNTSAIIAGGKASCKCNNSSGASCVYKSKSVPFVGTFGWCDGKCDDCTLRGVSIAKIKTEGGGGVIKDLVVTPDPVLNKELICQFVSEKILSNVELTVRNARTGDKISKNISTVEGNNTEKFNLNNRFTGVCILELRVPETNERHAVTIMVD